MAKGEAIGYPVCKICGEAHPFRDGHSWDRLPNKKQIDGVVKSAASRGLSESLAVARKALDAAPVPKLDRAMVTIDGELIQGPKSPGRPKGDTDRKAYQRELMRKKRAAEKAAKEGK